MTAGDPRRRAARSLSSALLLLGLLASCGGSDDDAAGGGGPRDAYCAPQAGRGVAFDSAQPPCERLSSYRLFTDGGRQIPNDGVVPYELNTPLFSDYAAKHRFVYVPPGQSVTYRVDAGFVFPVGTVLVKTFSYPHDLRDPALGERLIESRLLLHGDDGWRAVTYLWDDQHSEATLLTGGASVDVDWIEASGRERGVEFLVPSQAQCAQCHEEAERVLGPVGPKARHLNRDLAYADGSESQLSHWTRLGILSGAPSPETAPRNAVWDDPSTGTVEDRARAYLDVNCAHCHSPTGRARSSGLDLRRGNADPLTLGVCKAAASGGGSGAYRYDIVPGRPEESSLLHRMRSVDSGVAMPPVGRQLVHDEAVALIEEWIAGLAGSCDR